MPAWHIRTNFIYFSKKIFQFIWIVFYLCYTFVPEINITGVMLHLINVFLKGFILKKDEFFQLFISSKMRIGLYFGFYVFFFRHVDGIYFSVNDEHLTYLCGYFSVKRNFLYVSKLEYYLPRYMRFSPVELVRECPSIVSKYRSLSSFLPRFLNGLNYFLFYFGIYPSVD